jgi:hypothetical protein
MDRRRSVRCTGGRPRSCARDRRGVRRRGRMHRRGPMRPRCSRRRVRGPRARMVRSAGGGRRGSRRRPRRSRAGPRASRPFDGPRGPCDGRRMNRRRRRRGRSRDRQGSRCRRSGGTVRPAVPRLVTRRDARPPVPVVGGRVGGDRGQRDQHHRDCDHRPQRREQAACGVLARGHETMLGAPGAAVSCPTEQPALPSACTPAMGSGAPAWCQPRTTSGLRFDKPAMKRLLTSMCARTSSGGVNASHWLSDTSA